MERAILVDLTPPQIMERLAASIADERQAIFHGSQAAFMGTFKDFTFRILPNVNVRSHPKVGYGMVEWTGSASRINLSFEKGSFGGTLVLVIFSFLSLFAILIGVFGVVTKQMPVKIAILIVIGSILFIGLGIGINLILRSLARSQEARIFGFVESLFPKISPQG